jgi:phosphate transport system substrate-binding protein
MAYPSNVSLIKRNTFGKVVIFSVFLILSQSVFALKYAAPEHSIKVDPKMPIWVPGQVESIPEEELNLVGADVMDEMTLGWMKIFRKQYPRLSLTMEARASGAAGPGLTNEKGHLAPIGREMMPKEEQAFVDKFGYKPTPIRVATGSAGSLGKTAASVIFVDKNNPIKGLSLDEVDAIYSKTRNRGHSDISTWGQLGLTGEWANLPIHLYGLKPVNGIEQFLKIAVLKGGEYKENIQFVKGVGFSHAFNVAADDMASHPGGLTYALLANLKPNVKVLALSEKKGDPYYLPTVENVYTHKYPLSRYVYIYINKKPGVPLEAKVKEFLKLVLSKQGQEVVANERVYLPMTTAVVLEERKKLDNLE